jgi:hypothetical protein
VLNQSDNRCGSKPSRHALNPHRHHCNDTNTGTDTDTDNDATANLNHDLVI